MITKPLPASPLVAVLVAVSLGLACVPASPPVRRAASSDDHGRAKKVAEFSLPGVRESRFLNAEANVKYVGSAICSGCHPTATETYLQTTHSKALDDPNPWHEPAAAHFRHTLSGRNYEVYYQDGQIWHRESIDIQDGEKLVLADYPMRYAIGSGNHSRSYIAALDGFLVESPITWYASKGRWDMSPGYDHERHRGFERAVDAGCLVCHAGRVTPIASAVAKVEMGELAIGCESCHGPGSLHALHHESNAHEPGAADYTIVHPGRMTRAEAEAVCSQCHLRSAATVLVRGRALADFRPGLHLEDFRVDYREELQDKSMTVVGHMEQMRRSRCYQNSETLTCTTCHDLHAKAGQLTPAYFRQKCLDCHVDCGLEAAERMKQDASDNCVGCHMPKTATDIPHFAFTHHRITLPSPIGGNVATSGLASGRLIATADISHLPAWEQDRCLALAYLEFSEGKSGDSRSRYRAQSLHLLEAIHSQGVDDVDVNAALARLYWEQGRLEEAILMAQDVTRIRSESRSLANALLVLGDSYMQLNQPLLARDALLRLVALRRQSEDWILLTDCQRALGEVQDAIQACRKAIEIQPGRSDAHLILAELYALVDNAEAASRHRGIAKELE